MTHPKTYSAGAPTEGHDKEDLVELEVVRLVKKFGAGKNSRWSGWGLESGGEFC